MGQMRRGLDMEFENYTERARGLIRVSLGRFNTQTEVDRFLEIVSRVVATFGHPGSRLESRGSVDALAGVTA